METNIIEDFYETLTNHLFYNKIISFDAEEEKRNAIIDNLIAAFVRSQMTFSQLRECLDDVRNGRVINLSFFDNGGDLFRDFVNPRWQRFAKELYRQRSIGLGTPNAASGMGELMFLFLGKGIEKPVRGDLRLDNQIIELKSGEDVRVMSEIRGSDFRVRSVQVARKYSLQPNIALAGNQLEACEIEKSTHLTYWTNQLSRISLVNQKKFVDAWLSILDSQNHQSEVEQIFSSGAFNQNSLIKVIIKILYRCMVNRQSFDKFVMINGDRVGIVLSRNLNSFNDLIDRGIIIPNLDYFRINQNFNVGWYISFH